MEKNTNEVSEDCKDMLLSYNILNKEYRKCIINLYSKIEELENKPPKIIYRNKCTDAQVRARRRIRPWL